MAAAEVDTSEWLCESCPFESGYRADYEAGVAVVSDDAARFGNGNGFEEDGTYPVLSGEGHLTRDEYQLTWSLENLGVDSRAAVISGGQQGRYGFSFGYRELPYRLFDTTQSVFGQNASGVLTLPSNWVFAGNTGSMSALASSLRDSSIESDRRILDAGGHWLVDDRWQFVADYRRQNKEGIDIVAGAGFTQSSLLPRVHDYETDQIDLAVRYRLPQGGVTLAWYGSYFTNKNDALTWETPFGSFPGAERQSMAQEPDNEFQQLSLSGHYRFTPWNSTVAVSLASGSGEQNQAFLPYTVNANIAAAALPRSSLNGSVDTRNMALTWTARPLTALRFKAAYRYDERDNTTPQSDWTRVIVDIVDSGDVEQNTPYSFERTSMKVSAELKLFDHWRVGAGYDYKALDRDFQEVAEQTEDTGWGQARWRPVGWADLRLRGGTSRRDIDRYDTTVAQSLGQNPLLRKYNLAYRYREFLEFKASASLPNVPLSLSATLYETDDSYTRSVLGLTDAEESRATLDLGWTISERASAYLMVGTEDIEANQLGSARFADADWRASHDDRFEHFGIGISLERLAEKLDLRLDYTRGNGDSSIGVDTDSNGPNPLPDLNSTLDSLRLEASYRWSERLELSSTLRFEQFSADDWALEGVNPNTLPTILTLDADPYDYDVWFFSLAFRYHFGEREIRLAD